MLDEELKQDIASKHISLPITSGLGAHATLEFARDTVHGSSDVLKVAEDERLPHVKAAGDDVLAVLTRQPACLLCGQPLPEALLIIGQLHHERALEGILEPLREHEWDQVTQVKRLRGWATACRGCRLGFSKASDAAAARPKEPRTEALSRTLPYMFCPNTRRLHPCWTCVNAQASMDQSWLGECGKRR